MNATDWSIHYLHEAPWGSTELLDAIDTLQQANQDEMVERVLRARLVDDHRFLTLLDVLPDVTTPQRTRGWLGPDNRTMYEGYDSRVKGGRRKGRQKPSDPYPSPPE